MAKNGVSSNGTEIAVVDWGNNRVLIWSSWPTTHHQAADIVLGQQSFTTATTGTTASTLDNPLGIAMDANAVYVGDYANHRFLIFKKQ